MSRASVSPKMLEWAIERSGLSLPELKERFSKLDEWLQGIKLPTLRQLEEFSKKTCTPLGFLFLDSPPEDELPIPFFRTQTGSLPDKPSPDLLESFRTIRRRQSWIREYLVDEEVEKKSYVSSADASDIPKNIATRVREVLHFDELWAAEKNTWQGALRKLRSAMEEAGVFVVINGVVGNNSHRKLNPEEFRGFVLVDKYAPFVFVNGADAKAAQMFTLAHELAHLFIGSSAAFDLRKMQPAENHTETVCNEVAAEFLVPEQELRGVWSGIHGTKQRIQRVATYFKVSSIVAARRALDVGLINKSTFFSFYEKHKKEVKRGSEAKSDNGGNYYHNQNLRVGKRFTRLVSQAVKEGSITYPKAFRLTDLNSKTFDTYVDEYVSTPDLGLSL